MALHKTSKTTSFGATDNLDFSNVNEYTHEVQEEKIAKEIAKEIGTTQGK